MLVTAFSAENVMMFPFLLPIASFSYIYIYM